MNSLRQRIIDQWGEKIMRRSAARANNGAFERFMSGKGYHTALEIGTYRGVSAAFMSQFCERVITIDLAYGKLEQAREKFNRKAFWNSLGCRNIQLILVNNDIVKAEVVNRLDFDFAFIDGAHDTGVTLDFELVKRCGHVLFHDAEPSPGMSYVSDLVLSLPQAEIERFDIFACWNKNDFNCKSS